MRTRSITYTPLRPRRYAFLGACQVVRERDFKLVAQHMFNLSEEGMLVEPNVPILTGEPLIVSFLAPYSRVWIDAEASVARVIHGRRKSDRGRRIGLTFDTIDRSAQAFIRERLDDKPPPYPDRWPPPPGRVCLDPCGHATIPEPYLM